MSLCSVTSDEYDLDDTIMDSFDDTIECDDVRSTTLYPVPSQPTFPLFTRGNYPSTSISQESWVVTPPTPTRLTLKMRPSSFILPFVGDEFYAKYDESEEYSDDEFVYSIDNRARAHWDFRTAGNNVFTAQPNQIPATISTTESVHSAIASDSVSFDENDENENIVPPSTPPSRYHDDITNPRFITSPPMIRLIPKRVVYLPFHSHDNYSHNDHNSAGSIIDNYDERSTVPSFHPNLHHLLLPDDF